MIIYILYFGQKLFKNFNILVHQLLLGSLPFSGGLSFLRASCRSFLISLVGSEPGNSKQFLNKNYNKIRWRNLCFCLFVVVVFFCFFERVFCIKGFIHLFFGYKEAACSWFDFQLVGNNRPSQNNRLTSRLECIRQSMILYRFIHSSLSVKLLFCHQ